MALVPPHLPPPVYSGSSEGQDATLRKGGFTRGVRYEFTHKKYGWVVQ